MFFSKVKSGIKMIPETVTKFTNKLNWLAVSTCCYLHAAPQSVYASDTNYKETMSGILTQFIDIIGDIFIALGILLGTYAIGQLVLAFKNEDADSKSRAATLLVVAIVLIAIKPIINTLGLTNYLK